MPGGVGVPGGTNQFGNAFTNGGLNNPAALSALYAGEAPSNGAGDTNSWPTDTQVQYS